MHSGTVINFMKTSIQRITLAFAIINFCCITLWAKNKQLQNISGNTDSANFYLIKAREYKNARNTWDAEKSYLKAIQFEPENDKIKFELGEYYFELKKYNTAIQQFKQITQKNNKHTEATKRIVEILFLTRKWQEVITEGEKAVALGIKIPTLHYMIGKSYTEDENYGKAKYHLLKEFTDNPNHLETVKLLASVYIEMSMYNEAIETYKKAISLNENEADLYYQVAVLYSSQNNDKEAVKYFELAGEKGIKKDIAYLQNLGMSYLSFNIEKGVEVLNKVLEKKPGDVEILTQIAQAYYKAEKYDIAHNLYFKMFENDNKNVKALYMSGVSLIKKGDKTRGAQICDRAIALDPKLGDLKTQKSVL